ncbi:MAG: peptidoglycan DD-metalloendopeptidase family protein [Bacilli bacterium]
MSNSIDEVRKRIDERKRKRESGNYAEPQQTEERYEVEEMSYVYADDVYKPYPAMELRKHAEQLQQMPPKKENSWVLFRWLVALCLLVGVFYARSSDIPLLQQSYKEVKKLWAQEINLAEMNAWYTNTFGSPLAFFPDVVQENETVSTTETTVPPAKGSIVKVFSETNDVLWIAVEPDEPIVTMKKGQVQYIGKDEDGFVSVEVAHSDGTVSIYGNLTDVRVRLYDKLPVKTVIGFATDQAIDGANVYIGILKNSEYIDPEQVISFE